MVIVGQCGRSLNVENMEDDPDDPKAETFKRHETSKAGASEKEVRAPRQKSILGFFSRAPKKCQQAVETLVSG